MKKYFLIHEVDEEDAELFYNPMLIPVDQDLETPKEVFDAHAGHFHHPDIVKVFAQERPGITDKECKMVSYRNYKFVWSFEGKNGIGEVVNFEVEKQGIFVFLPNFNT